MTQSISHWTRTFFQLQLFYEYFLTDRVWTPALLPLFFNIRYTSAYDWGPWLLLFCVLCTQRSFRSDWRRRRKQRGNCRRHWSMSQNDESRQSKPWNRHHPQKVSDHSTVRQLTRTLTYLNLVKGVFFHFIVKFYELWIPRYGICNVDDGHFMLNILFYCVVFLLRIIWWNMFQYVR